MGNNSSVQEFFVLLEKKVCPKMKKPEKLNKGSPPVIFKSSFGSIYLFRNVATSVLLLR